MTDDMTVGELASMLYGLRVDVSGQWVSVTVGGYGPTRRCSSIAELFATLPAMAAEARRAYADCVIVDADYDWH